MQLGPVTLDELKRTLFALPNKESEVEGDVPFKILKLTFNILGRFLMRIINSSLLTRALLGLVRTLPFAGGGGPYRPPSISETNRHRGKIQTAMERPGRDLSD